MSEASRHTFSTQCSYCQVLTVQSAAQKYLDSCQSEQTLRSKDSQKVTSGARTEPGAISGGLMLYSFNVSF